MNWADQHGVSYLAWGWEVLTAAGDQDEQGCSAFYLIATTAGTPAAPNGTALHDHLLTLPLGGVISTGGTTGTTGANTAPAGATTTTATPGGAANPSGGCGSRQPATVAILAENVKSGGRGVGLTLRSPQDCSGTLTVRTVKSYALAGGKRKRRPVSQGTIHFTLKAGKAKTVVLALSSISRKLLAAEHTLKVRIAITLSSSPNHRFTVNRTLTLGLPAKHNRARPGRRAELLPSAEPG